MKLDELLKTLKNDKEILRFQKEFKEVLDEEFEIEIEEVQHFNFKVILKVNIIGRETEVIQKWEFFNREEYENYMPVISEERYDRIVGYIKNYIYDVVEDLMEE